MKVTFSRNMNGDVLVLVDDKVAALAKECEGYDYLKAHILAFATPPKDAHAKIGDIVWFRMGRMHGYSSQQPVRAMVTKVHANERVDLEIGCEDMSQVFGTAGMVSHRDTLPVALREQQACWWNDSENET